MNTTLLTSRMRDVLHRIERANRPPFHTMSPKEARAAYLAGAEILEPPRVPLARVSDFTIPAADGAPLPARMYAPQEGLLPGLLYLHGGGFTIGGIETHDSLCRQLSIRSGAAVVSLDYRLAPESRFPVAVEDSWAAMRWLAEHGASIGVDGKLLSVGGDSAGGTLAAVCALHARDIGLPLVMQVLITPGTTAHADTASHQQFATGYLLDEKSIEWFFRQYVDEKDREDWRFAPLLVEDVSGVAPACVVLAECDPLVDEGVAYADRLRMAGIEVQLELVRGMTHDFIKMGRALPEAEEAKSFIGATLRDAIQRGPGR